MGIFLKLPQVIDPTMQPASIITGLDIVPQDGEGSRNRAPEVAGEKGVCLAFGKTELRKT